MMRKAIVLLWILLFSVGFQSCQNGNKKDQAKGLHGELIIFHAGSLSIPFQLIADEFEKENPGVKVFLEAAGSVACARKITDLKKDCDIMASADYEVIDRFLIPEYADWNIHFAANEMVIAYNNKSKRRDQITAKNWYKILNDSEVIFGRSDPNSDPCGYRSVMTTQLTALIEKDPTIIELLDKDQNFMRPKEVDLLGLLEANAIDYIFIYKSVAQQHDLNMVSLSDSINLSNHDLLDWYTQAQVDISGKKPGEFVRLNGSPMKFGISLLKNAPNPEIASTFLEFFFETQKGMKIIAEQGQDVFVPAPSSNYNLIPKYLKKFVLDTVR